MFSHASENETTESFPAAGRHYDQAGTQSFRRLKNFDGRIAHQDLDFVTGFAIDFAACSRSSLLRAAVSILPNGKATSGPGGIATT